MFKILNIVLNVLKIWLNHEVVVTLMDLPPGCFGAHDVPFMKNLRKFLIVVYHLIQSALKMLQEQVLLKNL